MSRGRVSLTNGTSRGVVLDLIRARGPISRVALAEATGLTQATMSTVVRQLIAEGLVIESGRGESTGGKPPVMLDVNPASRYSVGVQFGRESITYVVIDLAGAIVGRTRTPGIGAAHPEEMVNRVADEIGRMLSVLGIPSESVLGVGVVAPGPLDLRRGVILDSPHLAAWQGVPLQPLLSEAIGLPVILENDATAAALGDFWSGRLAGAIAHASVYMGTGIGAGVLIDGTVFRGASSNAGELGRTIVADQDGRLVSLEDVADPASVVQRARALGIAEALDLAGEDEFEDFRAIAMAAVRGDEAAAGLIDESARWLATAVLSLAFLFDLDSVSLAGPAFTASGPDYVRAVRTLLDTEFGTRLPHPIRVQLSADVADSAAVGGAALVLQNELAPRSMGLRQP